MNLFKFVYKITWPVIYTVCGMWIAIIASWCSITPSVTIVTCTGLWPKPAAMKVKDFRIESFGFSGTDLENRRQYYFKDVNQVCYTMSEMEFDKAQAAGR